MVLFSIFLLICVILVFFTSYQKDNALCKNYGEMCLLLFVILFSGLRYGFSWDYFTYVGLYNTIEFGDFFSLSSYGTIEPFFLWLVYFLRDVFNTDVQVLFIVYAFIMYSIFFKTYKEYNCKQAVLLFFFFLITNRLFFQSLSYIRQFLAVAIVFWACRYIYQENLKKYLFTVLFALFFHYSALIMLPIYYFARIRVKTLTYMLVLACSVAISFFLPAIMEILLTIIASFSAELGIITKAIVYFSFEGNRISLSVVFELVLFILIVLCIHKTNNDMKKICIVNMCFFSVIMYILFCNNEVFIRLAAYFNIFTPIGLVLVANKLNISSRLIFYMVVSVYYIAVLFNSINAFQNEYNFYIDIVLPSFFYFM